MPPPGTSLLLILMLVSFDVANLTKIHEGQSLLNREVRAPFNGMRGKRLSGEDLTNEVCK